jgi:hypothetical protein
MDAKLFPTKKCGCTLEQAMFLIAMQRAMFLLAMYRLLEAQDAHAQADRP